VPVQEVAVDPAGTVGDLRDIDHADRDGFAVADPVVLEPLDRVPERVPVVERLTADLAVVAGLAQVAGDGARLDRDALGDELGHDR
jgi:hypothetical protein